MATVWALPWLTLITTGFQIFTSRESTAIASITTTAMGLSPMSLSAQEWLASTAMAKNFGLYQPHGSITTTTAGWIFSSQTTRKEIFYSRIMEVRVSTK